ncbi:MAG: exo-alpha-sialidase [Candidatus Hydrogenedentes bacterium]|nr:exo-alpha-sialidase [Candidatus Hydrogenedentota bacterium]
MFSHWQEGDTVLSTEIEITVRLLRRDRTLTMHYDPLHELQVVSSPGDGVTIGLTDESGQTITTPHTANFRQGTELTLAAQLIWECRPFLHWLKDGVLFSADDVIDIAMDQPHTLTAVYGNIAEPGSGFFSGPALLNMNGATDSALDISPVVRTDCAGHWIAVWDTDGIMDGTPAVDLDLLVARSVDNGVTWTPPAALNTNAATDTGDDGVPLLATDKLGNWVAVWHSNDPLGGTIGADPDILVSRSTDNGASWTPPVALNATAGGDTANDYTGGLATDGLGHWVATWQSNNSLGGSIGTDNDILLARSSDNGATWTAPAALNTNAGTDDANDQGPVVATDESGVWVAARVTADKGSLGTDRDILTAHSTDNGVTWTDPAPLNTDAATDMDDDTDPVIAADGLGNWIAAWTAAGKSGSDFDILIARSEDNGASWTDPQPLNTDAASDGAQDDRYHDVISDGMGHWVAVWSSSRVLIQGLLIEDDIAVAYSTDNGAIWSDPTPLAGNATIDTGRDLVPVIATDRLGHFVSAWFSDDSQCGTNGNDGDILVATLDRATDTDGDGLADTSETDTGVYVDDWDTGTDPNNPDTLEATMPNGDETWVRGRKEKIRWNSEGATGDSVHIELWRKGKLVRTIKQSTDNDGKLNWRVPDGLPPKKGYEILIRSLAVPAIEDISDGAFRVISGD